MWKTNMPDESSADLRAALRRRVQAFWRVKLGVMLVGNTVFWTLYLFLSRHALAPIHNLPMTWLDRWAGFRPHRWSWVYESNFLLVGAVPWLLQTRSEIRRYLSGFVLLAGVSFLAFLIYPVSSPRPLDHDSDPFLIFITHVDGPLNAFPSLHAATLIYTVCLILRLFGPTHRESTTAGVLPLLPPRQERAGERRAVFRVVAAVLSVWTLLILFATLATKQHYALDLLAGALLGCVAYWFAWRGSTTDAIARASTDRNVGAVSHAG